MGLGLADYVIFVIVLSTSAVIGIYFGFCGTKQKTATEYMFGKGKKRTIPIALSIYSSSITAILIIGTPIEVYAFGAQFMMNFVGIWFSIVIAWLFVLPVFCGQQLNLQTPFEYFELRFNYSVRILLTTIHILDMLFLIPTVLYSSVVVFSEATNLNLTLCTTVIGGICIIYTMVGGFSAVIWSDVFQATLMMASVIFVMVRAITNVGVSEMWERAEQGGRLNFFTMDPNPFRRLTFWSAIIGNIFNFAGYSFCSASCIQRYMALKKEKAAKISTALASTLSFVFGLFVCFIGLAMYAAYYDCDPVKNKEVSSSNKLLPYFVTHLTEDVPGFLGLFNAGLLSAGLNTMSAELNTISGLIYHCFIQKLWRKTYGENEGAIIMKIVVLCFGILCLAIAPLLDKAKYIFSLILGMSGITYGLKVALVMLGTTFPRTNSLGAFIGTILSGVILIWFQIGSMIYNVSAAEVLPVSVANCSQITYNITEILLPPKTFDEPPMVYKLSFMYYSTFATVISVVVSYIVSYFSGMNKVSEMNPYMLIPWVRPKIEENKKCETELLNEQIEVLQRIGQNFCDARRSVDSILLF